MTYNSRTNKHRVKLVRENYKWILFAFYFTFKNESRYFVIYLI